ncbi:MAG: penicillin-binding transpeptidase domain-containing protein, partial [Cellulosilyticaceae bacterium]
GYTRAITSSQFEQMAELGYDKNDIIGQMGIEQTMEDQLRGQKGVETIEVDNMGRKVHIIEKDAAIEGNDVFLTIDANIQLKAYEAIEKRLAEAITQRMLGGIRGVKPLAPREILVSMVESNQLSLGAMKQAAEGTMQHEVYQKLIKLFEESPQETNLKEFLVAVLKQDNKTITDRQLLLMLAEQGSLPLEDELVRRIWKGQEPAVRDILIEALKSGRLKPDKMAITPFSASAVVVEVDTGNVLAVVGYPSYDSNEMTTRFNTYYSMLQDGIDQRNLLWNRALMTAKAPGSTFKMISALAGLEEGVVNTSTVINDQGPYIKAGKPYPKCWYFTNNGFGHGGADIHRALEVSCNYYFYELAYRLGTKYGVPYGAIDIFSKYAQMFGLDAKTGIELAETPPNVSNPQNMLRSNITKALNVIKNLSEEGMRILDQLAVDELGESILETNQDLIKVLKEGLQTGITQTARVLTQEILSDTGTGSLKTKTKSAVERHLLALIDKEAYEEEEQETRVWLIANLVDYLFENVDLNWTNAINIRTAIGQGNNAFAPVQIGRYIAGLANGKNVYDLKLIEGVMDNKETQIYNRLPDKFLKEVNLKQSSLDAVYEGMYRVVNGKEGSARTAFIDSKVVVAGKTGTAEEVGTEHSWFAGFAPYDNPEIAVVTTMYDAYGLGKYNYLLASVIFNAVLDTEEGKIQATMDNVFAY